MKWTTALISFLFINGGLFGQYVEIPINNPSFEDKPHKGSPRTERAPRTTIKQWSDCGEMRFPRETPPDIHPLIERIPTLVKGDSISRPVWQVTKGPSHGRTYLGMVVRDTDTHESVSQQLSQPLESGKCYSFNIDLARSTFYKSASRITGRIENYTQPAILRILGGTEICGTQELLGQSITVTNDEWRSYEFEFRPTTTVTYFTLEAFYKVPTLFPYNGHIILDNASMIKQIPCDEEELAQFESSQLSKKPSPRPRAPVKTAPEPVTESLEVADVQTAPIQENVIDQPKKNVINELKGNNFKTGQIIRINTIYFDMDSTDIKGESLDAVEQIYDFMQRNKGIVIEVGGHTNTFPPKWYCDELSSKRAKAVASIIASKGISAKRLYYKGYGKRKPIIPNDKEDMGARRKNQRVEIKILKTDFAEAG